jgi:hypothetical protein
MTSDHIGAIMYLDHIVSDVTLNASVAFYTTVAFLILLVLLLTSLLLSEHFCNFSVLVSNLLIFQSDIFRNESERI